MTASPKTTAGDSQEDVSIHALSKEPTSSWTLKRCQKKLDQLETMLTSIEPKLTQQERVKHSGAVVQLCEFYVAIAEQAKAPATGMLGLLKRFIAAEKKALEWKGMAKDTEQRLKVMQATTIERGRQAAIVFIEMQSNETTPVATSPSTPLSESPLVEASAPSFPSQAQAAKDIDESIALRFTRAAATLRREMSSLTPSERIGHIDTLANIYAAVGMYPCEDGLLSCEISMTESLDMGHGGYGVCYKGSFLGRYPVVMKRLWVRDNVPPTRVNFRASREVKVWKDLNHPRVLRFIGVYVEAGTTYMISPYMEQGDARTYVEAHPGINVVNTLLPEVAEGLQYLHESDIVHGDINGKNILISSSGNACIADFGLSVMMEGAYPDSNSSAWHKGGHPRWKAPELLKTVNGKWPQRTTASDMFSFGRLIVELTTGHKPYPDVNELDILNVVISGKHPERPTSQDALTRGLNDEVWALAEHCWSKLPESRPSAADVCSLLQGLAQGGSSVSA
ncbi:hypothetical protein BOTBODRAFT_183600 [Botryobasidium botryosum FD-172 SS1]|uniref:Protein kinase domain-containing protein n=1 Tax=Botryobasidium botryosum (strain FD-172 SS1) TaxID=930990 RepID=A0A067N1T0_BOTB1|nr:hypothetical protein BOTBODRAFT_183600 [Botryobasidium botryosum FD-172 SS1]